MLAVITTTLAPVAFVILLGYLSGRFRVFSVADRNLITRLVLTWLLPPLLVSGIAKTPRADLLDYKIPLIFLVGLMAPYVLVLLTCRYGLKYDLRKSALKASLLAFPDMVFMGIPILGRLFGPASMFPILIGNLVPSLLIMPLTSVLLEIGCKRSGRTKHQVFLAAIAEAVRQPRVWAPLTMAGLLLAGVDLPKVAISALDLAGTPTTGLSLFVVGLIVAEEKVRLTPAAAVDMLFKNLVQPAVMFATVLTFGVGGVLGREAVLLAAIPSAIITSMFAEQYRVLTSESSTTMLATRLLSLATIPLVLLLSQRL